MKQRINYSRFQGKEITEKLNDFLGKLLVWVINIERSYKFNRSLIMKMLMPSHEDELEHYQWIGDLKHVMFSYNEKQRFDFLKQYNLKMKI
jgi:hypothetical protein